MPYTDIYILSAVDIKPKSQADLERELEVLKIHHPYWNNKTFEEFQKYKAEIYESKYLVTTYDTAYFLEEDTAVQYAELNMADINESGAYPYLAVYSRPLSTMYAEANPCTVRLFEYHRKQDVYQEIKDLDAKPEYQYIRYAFDCSKKPKIET